MYQDQSAPALIGAQLEIRLSQRTLAAVFLTAALIILTYFIAKKFLNS